jgi:hypothetical protein
VLTGVGVGFFGGGGGHAHEAAPLPKNLPPPPPEGQLTPPPENEQYLFQPDFTYTCKLPEEAELYDPQAVSGPACMRFCFLTAAPKKMAPDVDTLIDPYMAFRHLLVAVGSVAVFGVFVYVVAPAKPTNVRDLAWKQVDTDLGGYMGWAEGKTTKEFR